jgi:hypothetical protein
MKFAHRRPPKNGGPESSPVFIFEYNSIRGRSVALVLAENLEVETQLSPIAMSSEASIWHLARR